MSDQHSDVQLQNMLMSLTDSVLTGEIDIQQATQQYEHVSQILPLIRLVSNMEQVFVPVQPSPRFVKRLHADLMGMEQHNMLGRVRQLPPRVQIAAGLALIAGFVLFSWRRSHRLANSQLSEPQLIQ